MCQTFYLLLRKSMKYFDEKALISRVKALRERYCGARGKSKFARELGISPSTYNYYELDRVAPIDILLKICEVTGADIQWLLTGSQSGDMNEVGEELMRKIGLLIRNKPVLAASIEAFVDLLAAKQGITTGITSVEQSFESINENTRAKNTDEQADRIPVLGRTAAGIVGMWEDVLCDSDKAVTELDDIVKRHLGKSIIAQADSELEVDLVTGEMMDNLADEKINVVQVTGEGGDDEVVEFVQCQAITRLYNDCFGLRIDGDSMSPRIKDGDIIIASASLKAKQGQMGIAHLKGQIGVTCKLLRYDADKVHLVPINEKYDTKVVHKNDIAWALSVICHVSI